MRHASTAWGSRSQASSTTVSECGAEPEGDMRTMALRRVILAVLVAATVAVSPAAWAQDETFDFTIDAASLAADRHTVVVSGTYTCGPWI